MSDIYKILQDLEITFVEHNHPAVFTVEEAKKHRNGIEGANLKNLFLRNKKGDKYYLLVTNALKPIDLKVVGEAIAEKKIGFASPDRLKKYLGLTPGSVSPFGIINDKHKEVVVLLDKELLGEDKLNFHPNINTATLTISKDDFLKFLKWTGNEVREIEI
jgi:Ala-tRNA(Pro) deacylase